MGLINQPDRGSLITDSYQTQLNLTQNWFPITQKEKKFLAGNEKIKYAVL